MSFNFGDRIIWKSSYGNFFGTVIDPDKDLDFQKKRPDNAGLICVRFDDNGPFGDGVAVIEPDDDCLCHAGTIVSKSIGPIPRNNDGRAECFWCHLPTQKRGGGLYDVCPSCGN